MNNIEQIIVRLKTRVALAELIGPDVTVSASDLSALIAQLEAAQKEPKETQEDSDIPTLRSEAASIIGLLTAEGHQTFSLDKVADFFDDVFRKFELAEAALSAANERLKVPIKLPKKIYLKSSRGNVISWSKTFDAIEAAGFTVEGK